MYLLNRCHPIARRDKIRRTKSTKCHDEGGVSNVVAADISLVSMVSIGEAVNCPRRAGLCMMYAMRVMAPMVVWAN